MCRSKKLRLVGLVIVAAVISGAGAIAQEAPPIPTSDQIKKTVDAWNAVWAAVDGFFSAAAWVVPWASFIVAQASAVLKWPNNIAVARLLAGNYGHAANRPEIAKGDASKAA